MLELYTATLLNWNWINDRNFRNPDTDQCIGEQDQMRAQWDVKVLHIHHFTVVIVQNLRVVTAKRWLDECRPRLPRFLNYLPNSSIKILQRELEINNLSQFGHIEEWASEAKKSRDKDPSLLAVSWDPQFASNFQVLEMETEIDINDFLVCRIMWATASIPVSCIILVRYVWDE